LERLVPIGGPWQADETGDEKSPSSVWQGYLQAGWIGEATQQPKTPARIRIALV